MITKRLSIKNSLVLFCVPLLMLSAVLLICTLITSEQQFSILANSFLHGTTHFIGGDTFHGKLIEDIVPYHGQYYWPLAPFPAILLMPFAALFNIFHQFFYQGYLQAFLIVAIFVLIIKLARQVGYSKEDSMLLSFGFILGSVFIGVATISYSWYFSQVITTFLQFYCLYELITKRRWWLIGLAIAMIALTRPTESLIVLLFMLEILSLKAKQKQKVINLTKLLLPIILAAVCLGLYDYLRFHNIFELGYGIGTLEPILGRARSYGLFSLVHVPGNVYYLFLSAPEPVFRDSVSHVLKFPYIANNPWGMSVFITSPYLLYLFTVKKAQIDRFSRHLIITIFVVVLSLLCYFSLGFREFGYRYALDFLPMVYLLFMLKYREKHTQLTFGMKSLMLSSGLFNCYLLTTFLWN